MRTKDEIKRIKDEIVSSENFEKISCGISDVWLFMIIVMAALVGLWGTISLVSGIKESGSLAVMIESYIEAVTGRP